MRGTLARWGFLCACLLAAAGVRATEVTTLTAGMVLQDKVVYKVMSSQTLTGNASWGLRVANDATAVLYIAPGATLTLRGANAQGARMAYAGMSIPDSSTLVVVGGGSLVAYGGNAGNGSNGSKGGNYKRSGHNCTSGSGGSGGAGGGGAAAGIGGSGGTGGASGRGADSVHSSETWYPEYSGYSGSPGGNGVVGGSMGKLYVLSSSSVTGQAGSPEANPGSGEDQGEDEDDTWESGESMWYGVGGGGGGGGGGVTDTDPSDIGGGSGGGGGGGGGGSGSIEYRAALKDPAMGGTGQGGRGGRVDGQNGYPENAIGSGRGRWGGPGGAAGAPGAKGGDGEIYASDLAQVDGGSIKGYTETHEVLKRTVTFDLDGGVCDGSTNAVPRSAYLFLTMPDCPYPERMGYVFKGFYTRRSSGGTCYYDLSGAPQKLYWDLDSGCTLYARWEQITIPQGVEPLVVTTLLDEPFDATHTAITLRAAVTFAYAFGNLRNPDGTTNKITFAESLWQNQPTITVPLTKGLVNVPEKRFPATRPLIISGPGRTVCDVVVDAAKGNAFFNVAAGNHLVLRDLTFSHGASAASGGALAMKGGGLRAENCAFLYNTATGSGGAVYAGETDDVWIENCRFEGNAAGSKNLGGGAVYAGGRFTGINLSFWGNSGTYGGAIFGARTNVVVNSSFFKNVAWQTGGGVYADATNHALTLVNCTLEANIANDQDDRDVFYEGGGGVYSSGGAGTSVNFANSLLVGNRMSSLEAPDVQFGAKPATLKVYSSLFGKVNGNIVANAGMHVFVGKREETFFDYNERSPNYAKTVKNGVEHDYLMTVDTDGDSGYSVYHDATWRNIALASSRTDPRGPLVGSAEAATVFLGEDISARDLSAYRAKSQSGSYWFLHDHPENGLVVTLADDVVDYHDGALSLREIVDGIASGEPIWTSNAVAGVYHVTFSPKLTNATIRLQATQFDVRGPTVSNGVDVVVDGEAKNIRIDGFTGDYDDPKYREEPICFRAFRVRHGCSLTVRNLAFTNCVGTAQGLDAPPRLDGGAILNLGRLLVENCRFDCCAGGTLYDYPIGFGGAICNGDDSTNRAEMTVNDSVFRACRSARGGAIYNYAGCTATVNRCVFESNRVRSGVSTFVAAGGAVYCAQNAVFVYSGTTYTDNTIVIDGFSIPNDIQKVGDEIHTIKYADGTMAVSLNALALPRNEQVPWDFNASFPNGEPAVSVTPTGLRAGLWYGLGYADTLGMPFRVQEGTWVQADAQGELPSPLLAPRPGDRGFYRIFVREKP